MMLIPDMIIQLRLSLEPSAADFTTVRLLVLVNELDVVVETVPGGKSSRANLALVWPPLFMDHSLVIGQGRLGHTAVVAVLTCMYGWTHQFITINNYNMI